MTEEQAQAIIERLDVIIGLLKPEAVNINVSSRGVAGSWQRVTDEPIQAIGSPLPALPTTPPSTG